MVYMGIRTDWQKDRQRHLYNVFQRLSRSCSRDPIGNLPASNAIAVLQQSTSET